MTKDERIFVNGLLYAQQEMRKRLNRGLILEQNKPLEVLIFTYLKNNGYFDKIYNEIMREIKYPKNVWEDKRVLK